MLIEESGHATEAHSQINAYRPRHATLGAHRVIALFDSPTRALECARSLQNTKNSRALKISLHVGECNVKDGKPADTVLQLAERAAETIAPSEIVVTRTLRDILAGNEFEFRAHGETGYLIRNKIVTGF